MACAWVAIAVAVAEGSAAMLAMGVLAPAVAWDERAIWLVAVSWLGGAALLLLGAHEVARGRCARGLDVLVGSGFPALLPGLPWITALVGAVVADAPAGGPGLDPTLALGASIVLLTPLALAVFAGIAALIHRRALRGSAPGSPIRALRLAGAAALVLPALTGLWAFEAFSPRHQGRTVRAWIDALGVPAERDLACGVLSRAGADAHARLLAQLTDQASTRWELVAHAQRVTEATPGVGLRIGWTAPPEASALGRGVAALGARAVQPVFEVLIAACSGPAQMPSPAAAHAFVCLTYSQAPETRAALVAGLAQHAASPDVRVREALLRLILIDKHYRANGVEPFLSVIIRLAADEAPRIREQALLLLGDDAPLGPGVREVLLERARDPDPGVRGRAGAILVEHYLGDSAALEVVRALIVDPDRDVRRRALLRLAIGHWRSAASTPPRELFDAFVDMARGADDAEVLSLSSAAAQVASGDSGMVADLFALRAELRHPRMVDHALTRLGARALPGLALAYATASQADREAILTIVADIGAQDALAEDDGWFAEREAAEVPDAFRRAIAEGRAARAR